MINKKLIKSLLISAMLLLAMPLSVMAQTTIVNPISDAYKDIPSIINSLSNWVRPIAIVSLLGVIIYGGYIRLTAVGNSDKEEKAMKIIQAGIIGFIIIVLAPLVVGIIGSILGTELITTT